MLTSLLEGEVDQEIINRMAMSLDFSAMKSRLLKVFAKFAENILEWDRDEPINVKDLPLIQIDKRLQIDSFEEGTEEAFQIFILMHQLADCNEIAAEELQRDRFTPDQWKAFEFIRSHTARIEINVDGSL